MVGPDGIDFASVRWVPRCEGDIELVVGFFVVRTVITCTTQVFGEALYIVWNDSRIGRWQFG